MLGAEEIHNKSWSLRWRWDSLNTESKGCEGNKGTEGGNDLHKATQRVSTRTGSRTQSYSVPVMCPLDPSVSWYNPLICYSGLCAVSLNDFYFSLWTYRNLQWALMLQGFERSCEAELKTHDGSCFTKASIMISEYMLWWSYNNFQTQPKITELMQFITCTVPRLHCVGNVSIAPHDVYNRLNICKWQKCLILSLCRSRGEYLPIYSLNCLIREIFSFAEIALQSSLIAYHKVMDHLCLQFLSLSPC